MNGNSLTRRALGLAALGAALAPPALAQVVPSGIADGVNALGERLLREGALAPRAPAYLLSPYNLHATLGLLAVGARGQGAAAFATALGLPGATPDRLAASLRAGRQAVTAAGGQGARVTTAYSCWSRRSAPFQEGWRSRARRAALPRLSQLDFAAANAVPTINNWARDATRGEVREVVERLGRETEFVLAGAVHFAGQWAERFDPARTAEAPFHLLDGSTAPVRMMSRDGRIEYGQREMGHAVKLPYLGGRLAMWVATARRPEDTPAFLDALAREGAGAWIRAVPFRAGLTNLRIPRMGFASGGEMLPALRSAGYGDALDADFSPITGRPVRPSQVAHRARIRVDEEGTVAAAASAVVTMRAMSEMAVFVADRPFVFVIGPAEGWLPLFMGYVGDARAIGA